jgi:hypothetical protein
LWWCFAGLSVLALVRLLAAPSGVLAETLNYPQTEPKDAPIFGPPGSTGQHSGSLSIAVIALAIAALGATAILVIRVAANQKRG